MCTARPATGTDRQQKLRVRLRDLDAVVDNRQTRDHGVKERPPSDAAATFRDVDTNQELRDRDSGDRWIVLITDE